MQPELDLIITGGTIVLPDRVAKLDIGIRNGKIQSLTPSIPYTHEVPVIQAEGLHILPGTVDIHVHFNEPGLGSWEGFQTGSAALAAGGITTYVDMPLNGVPPTTNAEHLDAKKQVAKQHSYVDYALWGGLVEGNVDQLAGLSAGGVVGFKAFMSEPGGEGEDIFTRADDTTLRAGMKEIARLGHVLALHAEDEPTVSALSKQAIAEGRTGVRDYLNSRPIEAEVIAVKRALEYSRQTNCALHFVHISSREAVDIITAAKQEGLNVTVETCPHYLVLTDQDVEDQGVLAKCAPPLRHITEQSALWEAVTLGLIDIIASDHSPCPPEMKQSDNFFEAWGGISGAQSTLLLMLEEAYHQRQIPLPAIANMLSKHPAERVGLSKSKGQIAIGMDADLVLVNLGQSHTLERDDLYDKHRQSPYVGYSFSSTVQKTMVRGHIVYDQQSGLTDTCIGQFIAYQTGGVIHG
ncbi:allantoinase [Paenibacillus nicotianae]|uniref:Allantoinase n=1 Tax=Paenibacillus nicotianae TaxID=1526551 RepID=A0ABW4UY06_9BACL